ncbi:uncharacterized protein [Venturia canescens]|uniref:uncharacterized protein n=1 Tax=Venturia canescens TaxID=32260 RepID=UPI001C9C17D7|nr:uncharacterized protein LOC122411069 [Venturia canescens]
MANDYSDSDSDNTDEIPIEILKKAKKISMDSLPAKSKREYIKEYNSFKAWRKTKRTSSFDEAVFIVYFNELSVKLSSATLWSKYSKLRSTVNKFGGIDIGNYKKLIRILKTLHANYVPKKSNIFTAEDVSKFFKEAPDNQYLDVKVVLAVGIMGACRTCELVSLKYSAVEDHNTMVLMKIPGMETAVERCFTI